MNGGLVRQTCPPFVDAIALVRPRKWLTSESFSMSMSGDNWENPFPICIPGLSIPSPTPLERKKSSSYPIRTAPLHP